MTDTLDIHPASDTERAAAFANLHDVWGGGMSAEEHLQFRLDYPKHRNATWYVGTIGGQVVVGLGCYKFEFQVRGETVPGFAFGEVHTRAEFRGKGYAPKLLDYVEQHQKAQGRVLGMLYSDIGADYYRRLGYELCPSNAGWTNPRQSERTSAVQLEPFERESVAQWMQKVYRDYHAPRVISIARSEEYWTYLLSRNPKDEFCMVHRGPKRQLGYVRFNVGAEKMLIRDVALVNDDANLRREVLRALIQTGRERGVQQVGGWMADTPLHRELFVVAPRKTELTMLKSLRPDLLLAADVIADVDHFQEIDHV